MLYAFSPGPSKIVLVTREPGEAPLSTKGRTVEGPKDEGAVHPRVE
jgi:hypothetical protein